MLRWTPESPYLKPGRLANVIAAITALGNYRYYKLSFEACAERINNRPADSEQWGRLFAEHPEFFRINEQEQKASLVWRRQLPKVYDPKRYEELSRDEVDSLSSGARNGLSRRPLKAEEITALIGVAVDMHERALEHELARKWWVPIASGLLAFLGALAGAWLTAG